MSGRGQGGILHICITIQFQPPLNRFLHATLHLCRFKEPRSPQNLLRWLGDDRTHHLAPHRMAIHHHRTPLAFPLHRKSVGERQMRYLRHRGERLPSTSRPGTLSTGVPIRKMRRILTKSRTIIATPMMMRSAHLLGGHGGDTTRTMPGPRRRKRRRRRMQGRRRMVVVGVRRAMSLP